MENKTTTELLEILWKIEKADTGNDWDKHAEAYAELRKRPPFNTIIGDSSDETLEEKIERFEEDLKLLKRHKHDQNNGDVLVRI